MSCGRSTTAATYVVEGLFGWILYSRVTNRLHCRKGCGDRFGMVLPVDASAPRLFAERYDPTSRPPVTKSQCVDRDLEADCRDRIIEVGEGGTLLKVHAKSKDPAIVWWGFDYLMKKFADQFRGPPHFIVARGAQWTRDSRRDFKVVGRKFAERTGDDPNDEEDG